jgi:predicted porin
MKKSLFAVAAATAFTGAAQAQSSVTVYGILDVGYIGANATARGPGNQNPANMGANTAVGYPANNGGNFNALSGNAQSTSRLGFRGLEDLGGGLSAFFTVEFGLQPNNAQNMDSGVGQNRQTFIGLRKKGLGETSLGMQYTTIHNAAAQTDPGQLNNMMGNVIYDKAAGLSSAALGSAQNGGTLTGFSAGQNNTSYTVRSNNMLRFATETVSGFKGNAFYVLNSSNTTATQVEVDNANSSRAGSTGGQSQNYGWGAGVDFTYKKAFLTANYQTFVNKQPVLVDISAGTFVSGAPAAGYYGAGGASSGSNVTDTQQYYAGTYDFGILKAYAQYVNRKVTSQLDSSIYSSRTASQIGVRSFVTPKVEAWLSGGIGKVQGFGSSVDTNTAAGGVATYVGANTSQANFNGWQVGSNYILSKRTNLYVMYGQQSTSNMTISYQAAGTTAVANQPTSYKASNYAVGIRHVF